MEQKGIFLVFEGGEGSGKTTQAKMLAVALELKGRKIVLTREPSDDKGICRNIRELLLNPYYKGVMNSLTEFLLFEASRAQHVEKVIKPSLAEGKLVICDRFDASTFAYQCGGRGVCTAGEFTLVNLMATSRLVPDLYIWIDLDPVIGFQRKKSQPMDRIEAEGLEFHQRVRSGYAKFFASHIAPGRYRKFDGSLSVEELHGQILTAVTDFLEKTANLSK